MKLFQINLTTVLCLVCAVFSIASALESVKEEIDKLIEDDITKKMGDDLIQSIEKKFLTDMERSVESVLAKIKGLLLNGTRQINVKLREIQDEYASLKSGWQKELEWCLADHVNETRRLVETALHQMVLCGYSLIGQDPSLALTKVIEMKEFARKSMKPVYEKSQEVYDMVKVCGHEHDTLRKVIKCVISKSPAIKTAMMDITSVLLDGVVELTKLVAHGAMHEACLIEVVKTVEDDAVILLGTVKSCVFANGTKLLNETQQFLLNDNATVLDVQSKKLKGALRLVAADEKNNTEVKKESPVANETLVKVENANAKEMKTLIRRMLDDDKQQTVGIDDKLKKKLKSLEKQIDKKFS